jgi:hypothetical protein
MNIAHQPGSEPLTIPEQIPNPAVRPEAPPSPGRRPVPKEPVKVPEKVPAHHYGTGSQAADLFGHGNLHGEYSLSG